MANVFDPVELCEETDCANRGEPCFYPDNQEEPAHYYCTKHAWDNGFCWQCGQFWGGVEAFEFSASHLCPNCWSSDDVYDPFVSDGYEFEEDPYP